MFVNGTSTYRKFGSKSSNYTASDFFLAAASMACSEPAAAGVRFVLASVFLEFSSPSLFEIVYITGLFMSIVSLGTFEGSSP